jgi:hypothetical protein
MLFDLERFDEPSVDLNSVLTERNKFMFLLSRALQELRKQAQLARLGRAMLGPIDKTLTAEIEEALK